MNWSNSAKPKILVVDNHQPSRFLIDSLLSVDGYEVIESTNGNQALIQVSEEDLDLVLLEVVLPGINGFEVCRRLKRNEQTRLTPVVFITHLSDRQSRIAGIEAGGDDFILKPFDPQALSARVKSLIYQKRLNEDLDHAGRVLFSIAQTVESRDPNTGNHCERLMIQAKAFGEFLHLPRTAIRDLMWAGYLHDIGKVGIPDSVLLKPGKLSAAELTIMQQHVLIGEKICQPLRTMQGVLPIIRHHHERWDGSGYPDGLAGEQIPYLAQVFQIIDIYDALTNERPYKRALTATEALKILVEEAAKGWRNPVLVQQFSDYMRLTRSSAALEGLFGTCLRDENNHRFAGLIGNQS